MLTFLTVLSSIEIQIKAPPSHEQPLVLVTPQKKCRGTDVEMVFIVDILPLFAESADGG